MQKNKKLLKILYIVLALVVCVTIFCFGAVLFGKKNSDGSNGQQTEGNLTGSSDDQTGCLFDGLVHGSNMLKAEPVNIDGVKTIVYFLDDYEKKPIVILQHGLTSKKEDVKDLATAIANAGYVVVTPDAAGHGEMKSKDRVSVVEMAEQTALNFETVLDYFQTSCYADVERIGLAGFSLGGLASFYYTANGNYNPDVVISLCSTPDFDSLADTYVAYQFCKNGVLSGVKNEKEKDALEEQIRSNSPYDKLLADTDTCFFMVCGDADDVVPHEGNIRFYEEGKDVCKDIKLIVKEKQKHEVTEEDLMQMLEYLKGHL